MDLYRELRWWMWIYIIYKVYKIIYKGSEGTSNVEASWQNEMSSDDRSSRLVLENISSAW